MLDSTEQYQLGGISNVRGFAPGEAVGDNGQSATAELGLPVYGIPKDLRIPFSSAKLYDALRVAAFYDWGHVFLRDPQPGEFKDRILDDEGCGLRLTLPENFFFRLDFAWPVTGQPSDDRMNIHGCRLLNSFDAKTILTIFLFIYIKSFNSTGYGVFTEVF